MWYSKFCACKKCYRNRHLDGVSMPKVVTKTLSSPLCIFHRTGGTPFNNTTISTVSRIHAISCRIRCQTMNIFQMTLQIRLPIERTRTHAALKRFIFSICMFTQNMPFQILHMNIGVCTMRTGEQSFFRMRVSMMWQMMSIQITSGTIFAIESTFGRMLNFVHSQAGPAMECLIASVKITFEWFQSGVLLINMTIELSPLQILFSAVFTMIWLTAILNFDMCIHVWL